LNSIEKAIKDANLEKKNIDNVVLAGGSSRTPKLQKMINEYFGKEGLVTINPDEAIAYGATVAAYVETSINEIENKDSIKDKIDIKDKVTFPVGIEVDGGKMITIIKKSTELPEKGKKKLFSKTFMPKNDFGKGYYVNIYEGESEFIKNNHLLGNYIVTGIPFNIKEKTIVKIILEIDHDSIITLVVKTNDVENKKITIKKENMYSEEDMKRFKDNIIEFNEKEKMRKLVITDLNTIVDLNNKLKKNVNNSKIGNDDKIKIKKKCSEIEKWVQKNQEPTKNECEDKIKEITDLNKQYF
jgi:molecular chaperone DnaK (HSP70)